jgi:DNA-binding cell septation regulator SpoVG
MFFKNSPGGIMGQTKYKVLNVQDVNHGVVKARFDVKIDEIIIRDWTMFKGKDGQEWISGPSRKYEDESGQTKYFSYVRIEDDSKYQHFMGWLMRKVRAALEEGQTT